MFDPEEADDLHGRDPASVVSDLAPGAHLAGVLERLDPDAMDDVDDYDLVETIAAWARMSAWAQAGAATAAAVLSRRASMHTLTRAHPRRTQDPDSHPGQDAEGGADRGSGRVLNAAATEIAMRLSITRQAAHRMITTGRALTGPLIPVGEHLATGTIDLPRAQAFVDALTHAPAETAEAVQDLVLPTAAQRTAPQLARDIAAALITADPTDATTRHHHARERRRVHHPRPQPDGMASIYALLPAVDALALDLALDAAAHTAKATGDPRTTDHIRADALAALAHHALATGQIGPPTTSHPDDPGDPGDRGDRATSDTHTGGNPAPGSNDTEPTRSKTTDPDPAPDTDPAPGTDPAPDTDAEPPVDGAQAADTGQPAETIQHPGRAGFRLGRIGGKPPRIQVTVPLAVLLGLNEDPHRESQSTQHDTTTEGSDPHPGPPRPGVDVATLDGYGPITPDVARAVALGGTWQRLITDPTTGVVTDLGQTRYRPPTDLAALVRARDRHCTRPGCNVPAHHCQLDHTTPYHLGGPTALTNLGPLCPTDHTHKTAGTYQVEQAQPGVFDYTLPSGHTYRRQLGGHTHPLPRRPPRHRNQTRDARPDTDHPRTWNLPDEPPY